jgi:hypothetical protein
MSSRRKRLLLSHGYIPLADIEAAMGRVAARAAELDEHLALEYLLDPALAPLEQRIERLSKAARARPAEAAPVVTARPSGSALAARAATASACRAGLRPPS